MIRNREQLKALQRPYVPRQEQIISLGTDKPPVRRNFVGIVTECDKSSGFGKVQKAKGTWGSLTVVNAESAGITVIVGVESNIRVGDEVFCMPTLGIKPKYIAFLPPKGLCYEEPSVDDLCADQDDPALCSDCCNDEVAAE